jgi:hypothetical protein
MPASRATIRIGSSSRPPCAADGPAPRCHLTFVDMPIVAPLRAHQPYFYGLKFSQTDNVD